MPLPDDLKIQFRKQLQQRLPDKTMPHITLFEELALKEGLEKGLEKGLVEGLEKGLVEGRQEGIVQTAREAILDVLDTRFGQVPDSVRERVNAIGSEPTLKNLLRQAARASSLEEFKATL
jgi:flagellar biosynthesis/type III secretory pathway protein FliH